MGKRKGGEGGKKGESSETSEKGENREKMSIERKGCKIIYNYVHKNVHCALFTPFPLVLNKTKFKTVPMSTTTQT